VTVHLNFCGRQRWAGFGIGLWRSQAIVVGVQNSDLKLDDLYLDRHTEELTEACVLLASVSLFTNNRCFSGIRAPNKGFWA
jgi:hypothetical protein